MEQKQTGRTAAWKYLLIGAAAGVANGLFGSGGGLFLVPLFIGWLHMEQKRAFATSVAVILPLSVASFVVFLLGGRMDWGLAMPYLLGGAAGGLLSGLFFKKISVVWLRRGFGLLILYGGIRALLLL